MNARTKFYAAIILMAASIVLVSCNKVKLGRAVADSIPSGNYGYSIETFFIKLKKVNTYPEGSKLLVETYGIVIADTSQIYKSTNVDRTLPIKDTTYSIFGITSQSYYQLWKISGVNGDSLAGGRVHASAPLSQNGGFPY